ncbi:BatD family protein [uncultured Psychroserpens sp.]|uniref:BatD family protein n=1 Tax=uncultured Psychroserpens sp. TaxID=255436 RepID=UPI002606E3CC|nr:BatD family protein [uncultured Psychroserpens sp.]
MNSKKVTLFTVFCVLFSIGLNAQVTSSIDSTKIKIGEQITYKIKVEADTTDLVVFPEGQTFSPLEVIETYAIDTTNKNAKYSFIKKYGLTKFDSGSYTIPRQKVVIGAKTFFTDSLKVQVFNVAVDTTKQGLYDIKPIIEVEKKKSKTWLIILIVLAAIGLVAFVLYWLIWRKKPLTEEEEIALLPPYDRAKLALKKLDESTYLQNAELKDYYSELTFIIRKYLDEKVYEKALESTTDELISRLHLLDDANQIDLGKDDIKNLEAILKRADLVKFAKSAPNVELARLDRNTIDIEIDHVKEALPEPTEEEKLLDQQYKEQQEKKKKRRKIITTIVASVLILIATFIGFGVKYGFQYVVDTITGKESKELLEGNWVKSDYGFPPVSITTPKVLKRETVELPEELKDKISNTTFRYLSAASGIDIQVSTTMFNYSEEEKQQAASDEAVANELLKASEQYLRRLEAEGASDITVKRDKFVTPNNAEGLKTYGSMKLIIDGDSESSNYTILLFKSENVRQQILLQWKGNDTYVDQIIERILNSVELTKEEKE